MQLANQLHAAGLAVFPCYPNKTPAVAKGASWKAVSHEPPDRLSWPSELVGVPIPAGVYVIDLDKYKGATREAVEVALGCQLPWDAALIQTTPQGGEHYAFRAGSACRNGSNMLDVAGFDARAAGKGYICTGAGYQHQGFGPYALTRPDALPELPAPALARLTQPPAPSQPPLPPRAATAQDTEAVRDALRHLDPGCSRSEWVRVGLALKHHYGDDGLTLYDEWSRGELWPDGCPDNYRAEDMALQWGSYKAEGETTVGTVFYLAMAAGYRPPPSLDTALAFGPGATSSEAFNAMVDRINERGTDPKATDELVRDIAGMQCSALQRDVLVLALKAALREARLMDRELSLQLDRQLRPVTSSTQGPTSPGLPHYVDVTALVPAPLTRASAVHGQNALTMLTELFDNRLAVRMGRGHFWNGRNWQLVPDELLSTLTFRALMPEQSKAPNVAGTKTALMALAPGLPESPRDTRIYFRDCVLDAVTGEATPHAAANYNIGTLTVDYTPGAPLTEWTAFVHGIFGGEPDGEDRMALLQEILGWAMMRTDLNVQKCVAFDGASRAGKGVILDTLQAILGLDTCGTVTFANMDDGKTQSAFRHYDVVVDFEAKPPGGAAMKTAIGFMNKVASNEQVSIQLLNTQAPWAGRLNCKLVISCNGIPAMLDDTGATTNRFLVLYFTRSFAGREDKQLTTRIRSELPAVAAWAVEGARRLVANNGVFTVPATSDDALVELRSANQPLIEFIEAHLEFTPGARVHASDIWQAYRVYAADANISLPRRNAFYRSLQRALLGSSCERTRAIRIDGITSTGYVGLQLRPFEPAGVSRAFQVHEGGKQ